MTIIRAHLTQSALYADWYADDGFGRDDGDGCPFIETRDAAQGCTSGLRCQGRSLTGSCRLVCGLPWVLRDSAAGEMPAGPDEELAVKLRLGSCICRLELCVDMSAATRAAT